MKNTYSYLLLLIFIISCTPETQTMQENATAVFKDNDVVPFNANNPYEEAGRLHDQLFETYYEGQNLPTAVSAICTRVETIATANTLFNTLKDINYQQVTPSKIEYIAQHQSTCVNDIIGASSLSTAAKQNFTTFVNGVVQFFGTGCSSEAVYDYVSNYENTVIGNTAFTANDKKTILITTSITRHTAYLARKKPKKNTDPDWTILVGNIAAAAEGAEEGPAKAASMGLAAGIVTN